MVYYDITPGGILRSMVSIVANGTFWAGGVMAQHLGEPSGRVAAATSEEYAAFIGLLYALLLFGRGAKHLVFHMRPAVIPADRHLYNERPHLNPPPYTLSVGVPDDDSDKSSIAASTRAEGRLPCHAHCIWLSGSKTNDLHATPCMGKHANPCTIIYEDWFVKDGKRLQGPNFPLPEDLSHSRHLDYDARKQSRKCPRSGFWCRVVPVAVGGILASERAPHMEARGK